MTTRVITAHSSRGFARGATEIGIEAGGVPIPSHTTVAERWSDGSVRWAVIECEADGELVAVRRRWRNIPAAPRAFGAVPTFATETIVSVITVDGSPVSASLLWEVESSSPLRTVYLGTGDYAGAGLRCRMRIEARRDGSALLSHTIIATADDAAPERISVTANAADHVLLNEPIDWQPATIMAAQPSAWTDTMPVAARETLVNNQIPVAGLSLTHTAVLAGRPQTDGPQGIRLIGSETPRMAANCGTDAEQMISDWWDEYLVPLTDLSVASRLASPLFNGNQVGTNFVDIGGTIYPAWVRYGHIYGVGLFVGYAWLRTGEQKYRDVFEDMVRVVCDHIVIEHQGRGRGVGGLRAGIETTPFVWYGASARLELGGTSLLDAQLLLASRALGCRRAGDCLDARVEYVDWHQAAYCDGKTGFNWLGAWGVTPWDTAHTLMTLWRWTNDDDYLATGRKIIDLMLDETEEHGLSEAAWEAIRGGAAYLTATYKIDRVLSCLWDWVRETRDADLRTAAIRASGWALEHRDDPDRVGWGIAAQGYQCHAGYWLGEYHRATDSAEAAVVLARLITEAQALNAEYQDAATVGLDSFRGHPRPQNGTPPIPDAPSWSVASWSAPGVLMGIPAAAAR